MRILRELRNRERKINAINILSFKGERIYENGKESNEHGKSVHGFASKKMERIR